MHGPTAAAIRSRLAPSRSIAAIVASVTPASAPRQPAWAAPTTPASASASSTGAQSAVRMPSSRSGPVGDHRVGVGPLVLRPRRSTSTTSAEWTWWTVASSRAGQHRRDRAPAVLGDRVAVVAAAVADVEARELAGRNAAAPAEEAVRDAAERCGADHLDVAHSGLPHDDVLVGVVADHEVVAADSSKP